MRRLGVVVFGAVSFTLLSAGSALAQSDIPGPNVGGEVVVPPGAEAGAGGVGGTAFTGTDVTVWMLIAAALLVAGVGLLFAARWRARSARS